jgi:hypothetical protein
VAVWGAAVAAWQGRGACRAAWGSYAAALSPQPHLAPLAPQKLGLTELGCKLRSEWNEAEEALFALGMLWFRRPNKSVQRRYLPHKTLHQLQVQDAQPSFGALGGGAWAARSGVAPLPRLPPT